MTGTIAWEWLFDPPALFDAVVYGTDPRLWAEQSQRYDVVALPGLVPDGPIEPGDIVVRRALGEGHVGDVLPAEPAALPGRLPYDRLVLRPRIPDAPDAPEAAECGCSHAGETYTAAESGPVTCVPAQEPDPTGRGPHPLVKRPNKRPAVGYAQQCLGRWMTTHATTVHSCGDPARVEQAFTRLRSAGQFPLVVDCDFGSNTDTATRAFQRCVRVNPDGAIGKITWPLLKQHDPALGGGGTIPAGRITEIDIDSSFALFANYFRPIPSMPAANLFDGQTRASMAGSADVQRMTPQLDELRAAGVTAVDTTGTHLVALRGLLMLPATVPETGTPLALLLHGRHPIARTTPPTPASAVHSYRGYAYLQRDLARRGIASLSVDNNVVNNWMAQDSDGDEQLRTEMLLLHLSLMVALVTGNVPPGSPLRVRGRGGFRPLAEVLAEGGTAEGAVARLRSLAGAVREARLDFGRLGVMGHSRGAWSALNFAEVAAAAAAGSLPPSLQAQASSAAIENAVATVNVGLTRAAGRPLPHDVKAVVSLQAQATTGTALALPEVFLLAIAGTHDEDVGTDAIHIYEAPTCAKALALVHGATHSRFNTVWAADTELQQMVRNLTNCQRNPVRVLAASAHQAVGTALIGGCFEGRLAPTPRELLLFTGERPTPPPVEMTRNWVFPHPVGRPNGLVALDARVLVANPAGTTPVAAAKVAPPSLTTSGPRPYRQDVSTFRVVRTGTTVAELVVPILPADGLADRTHVSCRLSKEFNAKSAAARMSEPLRNFDFELRSGGAVLGRAVPGSRVPSPILRPFPTMRFADEVRPICIDETDVMLQTVEVALAEFLRGTTLTTADLARADQLVLRMRPEPGRRGDDTFRVTDFTLTTRTGI